MSEFIARMIEKAAKESIAEGKEKYRAYFVNTSLYANWQSDVDTILQTDGYSEVIVAA